MVSYTAASDAFIAALHLEIWPKATAPLFSPLVVVLHFGIGHLLSRSTIWCHFYLQEKPLMAVVGPVGAGKVNSFVKLFMDVT